MRSLADSEPTYSQEKQIRRWLLAGLSLGLPVLAGLQVAAGHHRNAVILAAASAIAFFLMNVRTGVLNATLAAALGREESALRRERILRSLGTVLVTAHDRQAIFDAAVDHARRLAGDGADALLLFGDQGSGFVAVEQRLLKGRTVFAGPEEDQELRSHLPTAFARRALLVAPVHSGGGLRGALVVVAPAAAGEPPGRLASACEAVASAVSLALEAAELAERLVDERSEQRFGVLIRNSSDIVLVLRTDGTVRFLSPSVTRVLGWQVGDLLGRPLVDLVHPDEIPVVTDSLETALATPGNRLPFQCRYRHQDGTWRSLEAIGMSLVEDPAVAGIIVNMRDVTERVLLAESLRASEERLESQVAELQELHRAKNDFVATISHELRTPLTSILGQLELLADGDYGDLAGAQAKAVAVMDRNSLRLLALIEDLLTVARIDSARLQLQPEPTALLPFAEAVQASLVAVADARPVTLEFDADPGLGTAMIDAAQMDRALSNLLTNAIKFTLPGGRVQFRARRAGEDIVFTVSDDGIGIPVDEQEKLFTRFFRSSVATRMAVQGSGLGLVIAKSIVEEHRGRIELVSAEGKGTTVTVTVPAAARASAEDVAEGVGVVGPQGRHRTGPAQEVPLPGRDAERPERPQFADPLHALGDQHRTDLARECHQR